MIINKEISKNILIISEGLSGKGGVVSVITNLYPYYETFNHLESANQRGKVSKVTTFIKSIFKLIYYILFKSIKVVHIHGASYGSFVRKSIYILICKTLRVRIIYQIHSGEFPEFYKKYNFCGYINFILKQADCLVVLTNSWRAFYQQIINPSKIQVLNNIVSPPEGKFVSKCSSYPIKILYLGVITEKKGIYDLVSVIYENKEIFKDKIILHIGGVGESDKLTELISQHEVEDIIEYKGWVKGEEKDSLIRESSIYILPSYYEGLPISILEAMSYGKPILATNVGGISEIVKNEFNGLLFNPGNKDAIKNAILTLTNDLILLDKMGNNSLSIVKDYYPEAVIPQLTYIYTDLLKINE